MSSATPSAAGAAGVPADVMAETNANQARAAEPRASVWVSANAGTGKTYVLTRRVLRLLLAGTEPDRLLCLTYTNAAAAEMSRRVFDKLAKWAVSPPTELADALSALEGAPVEGDMLARAPTLFARAIEAPGGLKVQTIHAFCERLLQRFPLEAGVTPEFEIMDEDTQRRVLRQCIDQVLDSAANPRDVRLHTALTTAVAYAADGQFDALLDAVLRRRDTLADLLQSEAGEPVAPDDRLGGIERQLRTGLGVGETATRSSLLAEQAGLITCDEAKRAATVLAQGTKTDVARGVLLAAFSAEKNQGRRLTLLRDALLTAKLTPLARVITKKLSDAHPDVASMLEEARDTLAALVQEDGAMAVVEATMAVMRLADAIFQRYAEAKAQQAVLDYDDLISKTVALLGRSQDAQWVLYKLDNGLEHILVDEAQDTSPMQWRIVGRLAEEFFSGHGVSEHTRTLFAVGDKKQSIYGFQGARPEMFARMGARFAA
ncbi:MAG: UvrD-helicase domain-containing protein, partial [Pseudomonadota bacterium]